jgi:2-oxoisovalerate dehydrogenase E1 component
MAHSKGDDDRCAAEVKAFWEKDPIEVFIRSEPKRADSMIADASATVALAVAKAEAAGDAVALEDDEDPDGFAPCRWSRYEFASDERGSTRLNGAFRRQLKRDQRLIFIGEDIEAPYGGAFKVTKDLSRDFPSRVRNTPISEAAIVGLGSGLAAQGFLPVVEIMFGDFLALAADQFINQAAKFRYMYGGRRPLPLIIRTPMGGRRGYGPTHSQSLEKHFLGVPGTQVLALNNRFDPAALYDALFASIDRPTLVVENKLLYGARFTQPVAQGFILEASEERYPTLRFRPQAAADLTILCYGGILAEAEAAMETLFEEQDILCEIICPSRIYPFNAFPLIESVERTNRLLTVEEGQGFAAFASEAASQVAQVAPGALRRLFRLSAARHPIPAASHLEKAALPGAAHIVSKAVGLVHGD